VLGNAAIPMEIVKRIRVPLPDERLRLDHLPHPLRDDHRLVRVGLDEENDELVPP